MAIKLDFDFTGQHYATVYTAGKVAAMLHTTQESLYQWVKAGRFPQPALKGKRGRCVHHQSAWIVAQLVEEQQLRATTPHGRVTGTRPTLVQTCRAAGIRVPSKTVLRQAAIIMANVL